MRKAEYVKLLSDAETELRHALGIGADDMFDTAVVLGTGWGEQLDTEVLAFVQLKNLRAFSALDELDGHERRLEIIEVDTISNGIISKKPILILRGRIHTNEDSLNPNVRILVRLQIELLIKLGVKKLILTCSAGALTNDLMDGDIITINRLLSFGNEMMPLFPGEFVRPEGVLDQEWVKHSTTKTFAVNTGISFKRGPYMFFRGPHFETTADKREMFKRGAICVGMSIKPECAVAALYTDVRVIALGFISNGIQEEPNHTLHKDRAHKHAVRLSKALALAIHF